MLLLLLLLVLLWMSLGAALSPNTSDCDFRCKCACDRGYGDGPALPPLLLLLRTLLAIASDIMGIAAAALLTAAETLVRAGAVEPNAPIDSDLESECCMRAALLLTAEGMPSTDCVSPSVDGSAPSASEEDEADAVSANDDAAATEDDDDDADGAGGWEAAAAGASLGGLDGVGLDASPTDGSASSDGAASTAGAAAVAAAAAAAASSVREGRGETAPWALTTNGESGDCSWSASMPARTLNPPPVLLAVTEPRSEPVGAEEGVKVGTVAALAVGAGTGGEAAKSDMACCVIEMGASLPRKIPAEGADALAGAQARRGAAWAAAVWTEGGGTSMGATAKRALNAPPRPPRRAGNASDMAG